MRGVSSFIGIGVADSCCGRERRLEVRSMEMFFLGLIREIREGFSFKFLVLRF